MGQVEHKVGDSPLVHVLHPGHKSIIPYYCGIEGFT